MSKLTKKEIVKGLKESPFWLFMSHEEKVETLYDCLNHKVSLHEVEAIRLGSLADYL